MLIKPEDFEDGGEVDCCTTAKGRISIRYAGNVRVNLEVAMAVSMSRGSKAFQAYCHEFTPGSRYSKDVVLKEGSLGEVVGYTNSICELNDTIDMTEVFSVKCTKCDWEGDSTECKVVGEMRVLHCTKCGSFVSPNW